MQLSSQILDQVGPRDQTAAINADSDPMNDREVLAYNLAKALTAFDLYQQQLQNDPIMIAHMSSKPNRRHKETLIRELLPNYLEHCKPVYEAHAKLEAAVRITFLQHHHNPKRFYWI